MKLLTVVCLFAMAQLSYTAALYGPGAFLGRQPISFQEKTPCEKCVESVKTLQEITEAGGCASFIDFYCKVQDDWMRDYCKVSLEFWGPRLINFAHRYPADSTCEIIGVCQDP